MEVKNYFTKPKGFLKKASLVSITLVSLGLVACNSDLNASKVDETTKDSKESGFEIKNYNSKGIATFYDSSSRTIYAITELSNPRAYLASKSIFTGSCASTAVMMNFFPGGTIKSSLNTTLSAVASRAGISVKGFAGSKYSITSKYPAVYYYNFTDAFKKELHYNIVATDTFKRKYSTGWLPDSWGGCTYKVN